LDWIDEEVMRRSSSSIGTQNKPLKRDRRKKVSDESADDDDDGDMATARTQQHPRNPKSHNMHGDA
jgi:hypothetical protein